jgi:hypothetical protein
MFTRHKAEALAKLDSTIESLEALKNEASAHHSLLLSKQLTNLRSIYFEIDAVVTKPKPQPQTENEPCN